MNVGAHPVNILSICTGGGGLDLGVELALPSARPVCVVERETFAIAHLVAAMQAGLMADCPVWTDARTFDGRPWRGLVDGLVGGIPCQPHSLAGRKGGQHDERDLWSDARRIIAQARPWFVLIENVAGMLTPGADEIAGAERVWRDLQKLGFAVEGGLFTASEVGAPHQRERVFILGVADDQGIGRGERRAEPEVWSGRRASGCGCGEVLANLLRSPAQRRGAAGDVRGAAGTAAADAPERQWSRNAADDGGEDVGHAHVAGLEGRRGGHDECAGERASGAASLELVDSARLGGRVHAGQRRPDEGAADAGRGSLPMANPDDHEPQEREGDDGLDGERQAFGRRKFEPAGAGTGGGDFPRTGAARDGRDRSAASDPRPSIFPPGPGDIDAWARILAERPDLAPATQPGLRSMADGMAPVRVDRLRLLGNGVVPLAAGYAFRTLVHRLATRGYAGAAELARLMPPATLTRSQP